MIAAPWHRALGSEAVALVCIVLIVAALAFAAGRATAPCDLIQIFAPWEADQ